MNKMNFTESMSKRIGSFYVEYKYRDEMKLRNSVLSRKRSDSIFYRRKLYIIKNEFVDVFNQHFNENNLPNQLKHGATLVGRWMIPYDEDTTEIFAIWKYDSYDD